MDEDTNVVSQVDTTEENTSEVSETESQSATEAQATTEKSVKPAEAEESLTSSKEQGKTNSVPYDRFKEVNSKMKEYEQDALLFRQMQQNPQLAQAVLKNVRYEEPDPMTTEADKKLREMGYVRSEDVSSMISDEIGRHEFIREFGSKMETLASKYTGADGLPKFDPEDMASYIDEQKARGVNLFDPEMAYEIRYREELADARAKAKRGTVYSEKPGKPMQSVDLGDTDKLVREAKETGDWSKVFKARVV